MKINYNTQQQSAIDTIDGQVLVNAGPGSGKTQVIAQRVGSILEHTDTQPENILILTFTNAGVTAMKNRLVKMWGVGAYNVNVMTMHSFGSMVLSHYPEIIGLHNLDAATEIDLLELVREILDDLPKGHSLRRLSHNPYFDETKLKNLFATLKTEDLSIEKLEASVSEHILRLPETEGYFYIRKYKDKLAGDPKQNLIDDEIKKMSELIEAARLLPIYNNKLKGRNIFDYADMLIHVSKAFDRFPFILSRYQENYQYFIADETQDLSGLQFNILNQLTSHWGEQADVMIVGDRNQSLYGFQGADNKNIDMWAAQYPNLNEITFETNYRSNKDIIDSAQRVIAHNTDTELAPMVEGPNPMEGEVSVYEFESKEAELAYIVDQAAESGDGLAIIYAKHRQITPLIEALDGLNIPYSTHKRVNVLYEPIIGCLTTMMKFFSNTEKNDALLYEILNYPFMPLDSKQVAKVFHGKRVHNAIHPENRNTLLFYMLDSSLTDKFFSEGIQNFTMMSPYLFAKWLIDSSGLLRYVSDDTINISIVNTFVDFILELSGKNPKTNLKDLLKTIKAMQDNGVPLYVDSIIANKGVQIMSAHASKGLEYEQVIMMDCTDAWMPSRGGHNQNYKFPDTITLSGEKGSEESARRAFYVAMTRAKMALTMTYSKHNGAKDVSACKFIHETEESIHPMEVPDSLIKDAILSKIKGTSTDIKVNDKYIAEALEDFELSFSAMDTYQKCPISFYYRYILKVPAIEKEHLAYGNAMHYGMEQFYRDMRKNKKEFGPKTDIIKHFLEYMDKNEHQFTSENFNRYRERGELALADVIKDFNPNTSSRVEQKIGNCHIEGVPVKGFIDRIDFLTEVDVANIDYKTGKYDKNKYLPATSDFIGGQHWRQGFFYFALIYAQGLENWVPKSTTFRYLESRDKPTVEMDRIGLGLIRQQIKEVSSSINKQDFTNGCGEETCQWCNLQKQIKL
jgi:DNA helicase-2/ATP-dependent DNA helicase PcrA